MEDGVAIGDVLVAEGEAKWVWKSENVVRME